MTGETDTVQVDHQQASTLEMGQKFNRSTLSKPKRAFNSFAHNNDDKNSRSSILPTPERKSRFFLSPGNFRKPTWSNPNDKRDNTFNPSSPEQQHRKSLFTSPEGLRSKSTVLESLSNSFAHNNDDKNNISSSKRHSSILPTPERKSRFFPSPGNFRKPTWSNPNDKRDNTFNQSSPEQQHRKSLFTSPGGLRSKSTVLESLSCSTMLTSPERKAKYFPTFRVIPSPPSTTTTIKTALPIMQPNLDDSESSSNLDMLQEHKEIDHEEDLETALDASISELKRTRGKQVKPSPASPLQMAGKKVTASPRQTTGKTLIASPRQTTGKKLTTSPRQTAGKKPTTADILPPTKKRSKDAVLMPNTSKHGSGKKSLGDDLTMNKLRFNQLGLYGRDNQKKIIQSCLERTMPSKTNKGASAQQLPEEPPGRWQPNSTGNNRRKQLVLISGYSGTGKTALASSLETQVTKLGGAFVRGRFDNYVRDEPYTGIALACQELCALLRHKLIVDIGSRKQRKNDKNKTANGKIQEDEEPGKVVYDLVTQLGTELPILIRVIPDLGDLVQQFSADVGRYQSKEAMQQVPLNDTTQRQPLNDYIRSPEGAKKSTRDSQRGFEKSKRDGQESPKASKGGKSPRVARASITGMMKMIGSKRASSKAGWQEDVPSTLDSNKDPSGSLELSVLKPTTQEITARRSARMSASTTTTNSTRVSNDFTGINENKNKSRTSHQFQQPPSSPTRKAKGSVFRSGRVSVGNVNVIKDILESSFSSQPRSFRMSHGEMRRTSSVRVATARRTSGATQPQQQQQGYANARSRLNYAFRRFIRILAVYLQPLVIVLDDLQWADLASLNLLEVFMTDESNPNLMVIGVYRSNEVTQSHMLNSALSSLQTKWMDSGFDITQIRVGNLSVTNMNSMVRDLLSTDDDRTLGLAKICHKKTNGNALYFSYFMSMLVEQNLLEFNLGLFKWIWDEAKVNNETVSTGNVVDLMKQRMKKMLSGDVELLLQLAACLGSTVDKRSLVYVWEDFKSESKEVDELLDKLVRDGYLCKLSNAVASYRWVHGAIQEASLSLIPEDELMALQFRAGNVLVAKLSEEELEASIFVVVNLLNAGSPAGGEVVSENDGLISHLNFQAALKSVELSAFEAAAKYAAIGVDLLPSHRWKDDLCDLTLDLYSTAAEIEGHLGMLDQMNAHCNEVLEQPCLSFFDKLRVFNVLMDSIYIREGVHEAIELCLFVLGQLGCYFPQNKMKRNIRVIGDIRTMRDTIKFCSRGDIENLPIMQDMRQIEVMKVLDRLVTYCYLSGSTLLPLVVSKSIRWSFRYGLCLSSPPSLAAVGAFLCSVLSDFDNGTKCGEYALVALECLKRKVGIEIGRTMESRTMLFVHGVVFHWTRPLPCISRQLLNAYEIGMQTGDIDSAIWSILHYLLVGFHSGRSLEALEADCRMYIKQGEELKREQQICLIALLWQAILNLMGRSVNPTVLTGEAMDQDRCLELAASADNPHLVGWVQALRAVLFSLFGEFEAGSELGVAKGTKLEKILRSHLLVPSDPFYRGICLFEMARRTKKQKYKKRARAALDTIKAWVSKGNPNLKHCERFLEAELAVLNDNSEKAKQHYAKAVVLAARGGFIHHAAMANERYGEFLLNALDLPHDAAYRFDESIKFYSVWGSCKADMLREKYSYLKR